ncbi:hypothetical protein N7481_001471 [Penicillium waksmanii]|uniref:uncharacterized protein n=1 Tax=Penicillium waksmanii TaxID=69791 RepID=UPI0025482D50|nr:uncharacterized protein N7481_001471 [Penicillium waksmanii]KAJ6001062.1 hypothetical protein N7481_001471 [Penicillium waksmanii]
MLLTTKVLLPLALSATVLASNFCQCEHQDSSGIPIKLSGIQQVCDILDSDAWCATNCNFVGTNCDYCQWKWGGNGPDKDYQALKSWCFQQSTYDPASKKWLKGNSVSCYAAGKEAPQQTFGRGCYHENNNTPRPALPGRFVAIFYTSQRNEYTIGCYGITSTARDEITKNYLAYNGQCRDLGLYDGDTHYVSCPYVSQNGAHDGAVEFIKNACATSKGGRDDAPGIFNVTKATS